MLYAQISLNVYIFDRKTTQFRKNTVNSSKEWLPNANSLQIFVNNIYRDQFQFKKNFFFSRDNTVSLDRSSFPSL